MFCFAKRKLLISSDNSVYLATAFYKSLHPYFAPLRSAKHQIYANDMENNFSQVKTEMRLGFEDVKAEFEQVHKEIEILDKRTLEDTNALAKDVLQLKTQLSGA